MGKVRTELVKRVSKELVEKYQSNLSTEFEENKQFLINIGLDVSKRLRNKIAGYITRIIKVEEHPQTVEER